jgi:hypothetical protein
MNVAPSVGKSLKIFRKKKKKIIELNNKEKVFPSHLDRIWR